MKKFIVLLAFLFAVVCYAAPPPELPTIGLEQTAIVPHIDVVSVQLNVQTLETQEVVYNYIGNEMVNSCTQLITKPGTEIKLPEPAATNIIIQANKQINSPPLLRSNGVFNNYRNPLKNSQHTNYGYPLSAD